MASINELQLAKELIKFPTVTPIDAGIMKFLEKKLKTLGFKTKILEFKEKNSKPVKNLYARLGNKGPNFCLCRSPRCCASWKFKGMDGKPI
jgi:succinyl-diaminopimelate desuccinylase